MSTTVEVPWFDQVGGSKRIPGDDRPDPELWRGMTGREIAARASARVAPAQAVNE
jgi:hypothetical protein